MADRLMVGGRLGVHSGVAQKLSEGARNRPSAQAPSLPPNRTDLLSHELRRLPAVGDFANAYERHKQFIALYGARTSSSGGPAPAPGVSEYDIARAHSRFIWHDEADASTLVWEERVAKKYWERLFKEYAVADLSRFEHGQVGLRWRTEKEVVDGKGQFICANKPCREAAGLCSYEVNFKYEEHGKSHNALIKVRVCQACALKLNYKHMHARAPPPRSGSVGPSASAAHGKRAHAEGPALGVQAREKRRTTTPAGPPRDGADMARPAGRLAPEAAGESDASGRGAHGDGVWQRAAAEAQPSGSGVTLANDVNSDGHGGAAGRSAAAGVGNAVNAFESYLQSMLL